MEKKLQKMNPTDDNLVIVQRLWQAYYMSIVFLKECIKIDINRDTVIINVKLAELKMNIATDFLNIRILKKKNFTVA